MAKKKKSSNPSKNPQISEGRMPFIPKAGPTVDSTRRYCKGGRLKKK